MLPDEIALPGNQTFPLAVVGESNWQENLESLCGGRTKDGINQIEIAKLCLENSNPYDTNAVAVEIRGHRIGYLNKVDAIAYRKYLEGFGRANATGVCFAQIRGGWKRKKGRDQGHFGVWLDFVLYG